MTEIHEADISKQDLLDMSTRIVSAYVSNHAVPAPELPKLLDQINHQLEALSSESKKLEPQTPAVSIKKSVADDYIICLEDGRKLKMLKRYLRSRYNMSPDEYRTKWGLPSDYPMVAPAYGRQRSELAKSIGLGKST